MSDPAHFAAAVELSDDAILLHDMDGSIRFCNPAAERLFGYAPEELVGQSVFDLVPSERRTEQQEILAKVRRGERISHFETVRLARDGTPIDISLNVSPVVDATGNPVGASNIARNLDQQRRLFEAQAYLAAIVDSADDAIISKNLDGVIQSCNPAAERLFGYAADELIGKPVRILIPPHRQIEEDEILARLRRGERIDHFETVRLRKDGAEVQISLTVSPVRDASGAIIGASKIARDITAQKRVAQELSAQREWFRVTLDSIGDAVIATDAAGAVTYMNRQAEALTGWLLDDAQGKPLVEVFEIRDEKTRQLIEDPAQQVMNSEDVVRLADDSLLISREGAERPIDDSCAPIRSDDGRIIGVVLVFRDVSEQRSTERERQTIAAERERLLYAERAARTDAERANRIKDEFVAMVSHELRTPLNAILGWAQLMMGGTQDSEVITHGLDVIARNTRLQARLISDLLDVSRIASGKLQLDIQPTELVPIIAAAMETVEQDAAAKNIRIRRDLDLSIEPIAGDRMRLQQIVWNLLANAIKFSPHGGQISVSLRRNGADVEIVVADSGVGISAQVLPYIFDPFRQADQSITRRFGGLGLGLAIVKHVAELHGGSVLAVSPGEGQGATFTVRLPAADRVVAGRVTAPSGGRDTTEAVTGWPRDLHVLVVEDEKDTAQFLKRLLESHGARVSLADSAHEALACFAGDPPQIVVSDIGLQEVDGYELMQRIRQSAVPEVRSVPAIALTAYARSEDRARALHVGYQAHLAKPVEPGELLATIVRLTVPA